MSQQLIFTNEVAPAIDRLVSDMHPAGTFVLCDTNTCEKVLPLLAAESQAVAAATPISIAADDVNKTLAAVDKVYDALLDNGATRHSLVINLGGGMVTDLGGFAASTFKRGMPFINVPTTLLGAVDASVGGKTGVNFRGIKNLVGVFSEAQAVVISTRFFDTLGHGELLSGYAEMIKHALISGADAFADIMRHPVEELAAQPGLLLELLRTSVRIKADVVAQDPTERGLRKSLNLGHTVGHAFEALAMERRTPVPHGYAVAWGLVAEGVLSSMYCHLDSTLLRTLAGYVEDNYGRFTIDCKDYPRLLEYMRQDKKNETADAVNFTLLEAPGKLRLNVTMPDDDICNALDIYRDLMHL